MSVNKEIDGFVKTFESLTHEISKVIVGQKNVIEQVLISLFSGGHCLIEGLPGLGKTCLVSTISKCLNLDFKRIQFTPDLMPSDITGTEILTRGSDGVRVAFEKGPVFTNVLLADEINRGTPRTQSALLEVMQERTITLMGKTHILPPPFFVLATQNPIELEGTYPLPEAQLDRFILKINIASEGIEEFEQILARFSSSESPTVNKISDLESVNKYQKLVREVVVPGSVAKFISTLVYSGTPGNNLSPEKIGKYVKFGPSPRALISLALTAKVKALSEGRPNINIDDVKFVALPVLRHRIILNFEGEASRVDPSELIDRMLDVAEKKT